MTALLAGSVATAFVVGFKLGTRIGLTHREYLADELSRLRAEKRASALNERFRGVDDATERKIMAEWVAEESARWVKPEEKK